MGLLVFARDVSLYELGVRGTASADVYPGDSEPSPTSTARLTCHQSSPPIPGGDYLAPLHVAGDTLLGVLSHLVSRAALSESRPHRVKRRCTCVAIHYGVLATAAALGSGSDRRGGGRAWDGVSTRGRVVALLSGPCDTGPGAVVYGEPPSVNDPDAPGGTLDFSYNSGVGAVAHAAGVTVDVLAVAADAGDVGVRSLQRVASGSGGGIVLLQQSFGEECRVNLAHLLLPRASDVGTDGGDGDGPACAASGDRDVIAKAKKVLLALRRQGRLGPMGGAFACACSSVDSCVVPVCPLLLADICTTFLGFRCQCPVSCGCCVAAPDRPTPFTDPWAGVHLSVLLSPPLHVDRVLGPAFRACDVLPPPPANESEREQSERVRLGTRWADAPSGAGGALCYEAVVRRADGSTGVTFVLGYTADVKDDSREASTTLRSSAVLGRSSSEQASRVVCVCAFVCVFVCVWL